ncbi:hypothetical protein [Nocardia thraciensis]
MPGNTAWEKIRVVPKTATLLAEIAGAGQPRNAPADHIQGLLSRDGMSPAELLAAGYGVELIDDRAIGAAGSGPEFELRLAGGRALRSGRVLVATGLPEIAGVRPPLAPRPPPLR